MGAVFGFEVGFGEVFTDNTEEEELDAAHEHKETDETGPAGNWVAEGESFDDDDEDNDESDKAEEDAEEGGEGEGNGGEGDDAFDGVFEEFPEGPFSFAGDTFDVFEFDPLGLEADEGPETFGIAVVFLAGDDGVDDLAGHEAVVAGAVDHFDFAHAVDELVEDAGAEAADGRFALAGDATSSSAVVFFGGVVGDRRVLVFLTWLRVLVGGFLAGLRVLVWLRVDIFQEFREEAGWILAVGVHGGDEVAGSVFETGKEGGFFAEVAGEGNIENARVFSDEGFHDGESIVDTAVVDEDEFEFVIFSEGVDDFEGFFVEKGKRGGFVVAGNDNADSFH